MKFLKFTIIFILFNTVCLADKNMKIGSKGKLSEVDRVIEVKMFDNYYEPKSSISKKEKQLNSKWLTQVNLFMNLTLQMQ